MFERRAPLRFWLITLAMGVGVAATASLGFWQLSRAAQRLAIEASIEAKKQLPAIDPSALVALRDLGTDLHRPVSLRGQWIPQHTIYLDNRQMHGRPGFYVLTPLRLEGVPTVVLVQRGWVARNFLQREQLPDVVTPEGVVRVEGRLAAAPSRLYEFSAQAVAAPGARTSVIRQNLDLTAYRAETQLPLVAYTVLQTGVASQGLQRDWPEVATGVSKHYGYAFQWFGLSGLMATLYVWFQFIAPWRARRSRAPHV